MGDTINQFVITTLRPNELSKVKSRQKHAPRISPFPLVSNHDPLYAPFSTTAHPHNSPLRSECFTSLRPSVCGVGTQSFPFVATRGTHIFKTTRSVIARPTVGGLPSQVGIAQ